MAPVQGWSTRFLSCGVVWERKETERKGEEKVETGFLRGHWVCAFLPVVPTVSVSVAPTCSRSILGPGSDPASCMYKVFCPPYSTVLLQHAKHVPLLQLEGLGEKGLHSRRFP